jgi:hypothetical protein
MSQELLYTSAPRGLKPGSRGFCTVLSTQGMPAPLATAVEGLSAYRPIFPTSDERASRNPVVYSHLKLQAAGRSWHVLSRIADYGLDYSQRANKLAHHVILDNPSERLSGGPANLLLMPGFMREEWEGEPKVVGMKPVTREPRPPSGVCQRWKEVTGDAGWAGVVAESFLRDPDRLVILLFEPGQEVLPLFAEVLSLLPPEKRWDATFSTYFTGLATGTTCNWRAMVRDSKEAHESLRFVNALRIDLTADSIGLAEGGELIAAARDSSRSADVIVAANSIVELSKAQELRHQRGTAIQRSPSPPQLGAGRLLPPAVPMPRLSRSDAPPNASRVNARARRWIFVASSLSLVVFATVLGLVWGISPNQSTDPQPARGAKVHVADGAIPANVESPSPNETAKVRNEQRSHSQDVQSQPHGDAINNAVQTPPTNKVAIAVVQPPGHNALNQNSINSQTADDMQKSETAETPTAPAVVSANGTANPPRNQKNAVQFIPMPEAGTWVALCEVKNLQSSDVPTVKVFRPGWLNLLTKNAGEDELDGDDAGLSIVESSGTEQKTSTRALVCWRRTNADDGVVYRMKIVDVDAVKLFMLCRIQIKDSTSQSPDRSFQFFEHPLHIDGSRRRFALGAKGAEWDVSSIVPENESPTLRLAKLSIKVAEYKCSFVPLQNDKSIMSPIKCKRLEDYARDEFEARYKSAKKTDPPEIVVDVKKGVISIKMIHAPSFFDAIERDRKQNLVSNTDQIKADIVTANSLLGRDADWLSLNASRNSHGGEHAGARPLGDQLRVCIRDAKDAIARAEKNEPNGSGVTVELRAVLKKLEKHETVCDAEPRLQEFRKAFAAIEITAAQIFVDLVDASDSTATPIPITVIDFDSTKHDEAQLSGGGGP